MRLACVKHAASVHSEPGSNSQVHLAAHSCEHTKDKLAQLNQSNPRPKPRTCPSKHSSSISIKTRQQTSQKTTNQARHITQPTNHPKHHLTPKGKTTKERRQRIPSKPRYKCQRTNPTSEAPCGAPLVGRAVSTRALPACQRQSTRPIAHPNLSQDRSADLQDQQSLGG